VVVPHSREVMSCFYTQYVHLVDHILQEVCVPRSINITKITFLHNSIFPCVRQQSIANVLFLVQKNEHILDNEEGVSRHLCLGNVQ
jgi:hypothetical protein